MTQYAVTGDGHMCRFSAGCTSTNEVDNYQFVSVLFMSAQPRVEYVHAC